MELTRRRFLCSAAASTVAGPQILKSGFLSVPAKSNILIERVNASHSRLTDLVVAELALQNPYVTLNPSSNHA